MDQQTPQTQGWLRRRTRTEGEIWLFCFYTVRPNDSKRVEHTWRVGRVADFPTAAEAWPQVDKLGLRGLPAPRIGNKPATAEPARGENPTFGQLAEHWRRHDLKKSGVIGKRGPETITCHESNLDGYVLPRWGAIPALSMEPPDIEAWFEILASQPQARALPKGQRHPHGYRPKPLQWGTIQKIRSVMSLVYAHAMRHKLIPADRKLNPFREAKEEGGVRCAVFSSYEATVVSPKQTIAILRYLDRPATQMEWMMVLLHAATALRGEEGFGLQWRDVDWVRGELLIRRAWSKGKETQGKNRAARAPVPLHPILAEFLQQWRKQTIYAADDDWIFPSLRLQGKKPRAASTAAKKYLRPAAVEAGVIPEGSSKRFGWHNLRHSLATFLSGEVELAVISKMLRQTQAQTTMRYLHRVPEQHKEAQGRFLEAIRIAERSASGAE